MDYRWNSLKQCDLFYTVEMQFSVYKCGGYHFLFTDLCALILRDTVNF